MISDQDTGKLPDGGNYEGPAIHTLTVFANPFIKVFPSSHSVNAVDIFISISISKFSLFLEDVPSIFEEGVLGVSPGETAPTEGDWDTLVFLPGIHQIGLNFRLHSNRFPLAIFWRHWKMFFNRSYYIPGDAIVFGTMNNGGEVEHGEDTDGDNIRCFKEYFEFSSLLPGSLAMGRYLEIFCLIQILPNPQSTAVSTTPTTPLTSGMRTITTMLMRTHDIVAKWLGWMRWKPLYDANNELIMPGPARIA